MIDTADNNLSYEQAVLHAEEALQLMLQHHIIPGEKNFAVWKRYAESATPELSQEIDIAIAKNKAFTPAYCVELYNRFIRSETDRDEVTDISKKLEHQLSDLLVTLSNAEKKTGNYSENLKTIESVLSTSSITADKLKVVLNGVISATQKMIGENATLNMQLQESTEQITEMNEDLKTLRNQAETDPLTGLANRRAMWKELEKAIDDTRNAKKKETSLCTLMLDIDHFKHFNDTYGHLVGDRVIKLIAQTTTSQIKGKDTAARYGGEEFTIILPDTSIKGAVILANNLREAISAKELKNRATGKSLGTITVSIGAAIYRSGETAKELVERADKALYAAKDAGRDQVKVAAEVVTY